MKNQRNGNQERKGLTLKVNFPKPAVGLNSFEVMAYVWVVSILVAASSLAAWIPVRRVMAIEPAMTLRGE